MIPALQVYPIIAMSGKEVLILNRGSLKPILQEVPGSTPGQARLYIFGDVFGFYR
jgi:hypothetical protein